MTEDDEHNKSLFEFLSEEREKSIRRPPPELPPPSKPFDPRAFDELYRQHVPPKQYRPASDFAGEEADSEARADALYGAYQVGDIDVRCPEIRALVRGLVKTFSGALLEELVNPQPKIPKVQQIRRRPRPKPKSTKLPPLF